MIIRPKAFSDQQIKGAEFVSMSKVIESWEKSFAPPRRAVSHGRRWRRSGL